MDIVIPKGLKLVRFVSKAAIQLDGGSRCDVSTVSSKSVDLEGDIIQPDGLDWTSFQESGSPVHYQHASIRVGKALWVKSRGDSVIAKTQYDAAPKGWNPEKPWVGDVVWSAVQKGALSGKSITVLPEVTRDPTAEEAKDGAKRVISKGLVMEYSVCREPVNTDAVVEEICKSIDRLVEVPEVDPNEELAEAVRRAFAELLTGRSH